MKKCARRDRGVLRGRWALIFSVAWLIACRKFIKNKPISYSKYALVDGKIEVPSWRMIIDTAGSRQAIRRVHDLQNLTVCHVGGF